MSRKLVALVCCLTVLGILGAVPVAVGAEDGSAVGTARKSTALRATRTGSFDQQIAMKQAARAGQGAVTESAAPHNDAHAQDGAAPVSVAAGTTTPSIDVTLEPAGAEPLVTGTVVPVYRLSDKYNGSQFFTDDWYEVLAYLDQLGAYYQYDGAVFFYDDSVDRIPVHRFYNVENATYFYTANELEAITIRTYYPLLYEYEGVCFKVGPRGDSSIAVHRFYRPGYSDGVYTASPEEYAALRAEMGASMLYDGVGFYVNGGLRIGAGTGSISGAVTGPDGAPLSGFWVRAALEDEVSSYGTWLGRTNASGHYTIEGLPPGDYVVSFEIWPRQYYDGFCYQPEYYNNTHTFAGCSPVSVTTADVSGINARLEGLPTPVYRFFKPSTGTHFYTADADECGNVIVNMSDVYKYEGVCYSVNTFNPSNSVPLHRFFNMRTGTHLYTADDEEANNIRANLSATYKYEGVPYHVSRSSGIQVHRFFSRRKGVHFFSADPDEIAYVRANLGGTWEYEGPSYLVAQ